jgi:hypothetical protein
MTNPNKGNSQMAKEAKINKTVIAALTLIQQTGRATQAVGEPLVKMGLIEVNITDIDADGAAAARLTQKGIDSMPTPKNANSNASSFALIDNAVLPESKRGFGRAAGTSKYPFADMNVGQTFFVANADVEGGDALKKLTSTVSNMNNKYRTETGETETKIRTMRGEGNKAVLDEAGNKVKETVTVPVYKQDRKFSIRPVKAGETYGGWKAPTDGALIGRTL